MRGQLHIVLGVAQITEDGHFQPLYDTLELLSGARAHVHAHAVHAQLDLAVANRLFIGQFAQESLRGKDVEHRGLQRHDHVV